MIVAPQLSRRVTALLNKTNVRNDFKGKTAGGKELQQYRLTLPEIGPLKAKVTKTYKRSVQQDVVNEFYRRTELPLNVGGIQLTKTSATQLTKWAQELNLGGLQFRFNQLHPGSGAV